MPVDSSTKDTAMDRAGKERNAVALGSLLRGLCRFLHEGAARSDNGFPEKWLNKFGECVDSELFAALVSDEFDGASGGEHRETMVRIVEQAIQLTSSDQSPRQSDGLSPVFKRIDLANAPAAQNSYFHWQPLTATTTEECPPIFAREGDKSPQPEVETYRKDLRASVDDLCQRIEWGDFDCVYTHFLNLLQRCAWCIPAEGQPDPPDISLYDQSRVVSAIATCLYKHYEGAGVANESAGARDEQTHCVLVAGDVSGIQDYIFAISTTGAGGVAKRLRARSFYVQMLSEAASLRVLREFRLPLSNVLMASGGNFYVLLPKLPETDGRLNGLQREFDNELLRGVHGALTMNLAWIELGDEEFASDRFSAILGKLHGKLQERKKRRLATVLQENNRWSNAESFTRKENFKGEGECKACSRFPATRYSKPENEPDREIDICHQCAEQQRIGRDLTKARWLAFYEGNDASDVSCLGLKIFISEPNHPPKGKPILVTSLNDPDLSRVINHPANFRYLANHVPRDDKSGDPWDFGDIAEGRKMKDDETTSKLLGVLKADVDHLGLIFQEGLRREAPGAGFDSIARIATLSRQIDWFFSGWLEWLLTKKYDKCYAVYSGGDDLLIVGPRALTLELARGINHRFADYTGNKQITMSAGIAIVKAKMPIAHTVKMADAVLKRAKNNKNGKGDTRDSLCVLDDAIKWDEFETVYAEIARLNELAKPDDDGKTQVPSGFLYQLVHFADLYRQYQREGKIEGLRYHPLLAYQIGRLFKQGTEIHDWVSMLLYPPEKIEATLNHLRLVAQWVILERREKNGVSETMYKV